MVAMELFDEQLLVAECSYYLNLIYLLLFSAKKEEVML
jgi:hypothetical protein